jgi:hypothetical protein
MINLGITCSTDQGRRGQELQWRLLVQNHFTTEQARWGQFGFPSYSYRSHGILNDPRQLFGAKEVGGDELFIGACGTGTSNDAGCTLPSTSTSL